MVKMTGAQAIVEAFKRAKVKHIFGIPGGATLDLYDVLYDSGLRYILTRHEQGAAHMADGYARVSGIPGVCTATSGPGATNLVTGIATAHIDSSPIIAFTGQVNSQSVNSSYIIGRDAFILLELLLYLGICYLGRVVDQRFGVNFHIISINSLFAASDGGLDLIDRDGLIVHDIVRIKQHTQ